MFGESGSYIFGTKFHEHFYGSPERIIHPWTNALCTSLPGNVHKNVFRSVSVFVMVQIYAEHKERAKDVFRNLLA